MIPYSRQSIDNKDIKEVIKTLKSDYLTSGPKNLEFENLTKKFLKAKYCVSLNNASSALLAACHSLGLEKGDIFWTVPNSFVASANCGILCGAKVDFVDIDYETNNISIPKLRNKLSYAKKNKILPKIIIPVHLGGYPYDQKELWKLSKKYNFKILEDASHAFGSTYKGKKVGSCKWSDITVFSFHPVKVITTAEGGLISTNNKRYFDKILLIKNNGLTRNSKKFLSKETKKYYYEQHSIGYNFRMNEIQSTLGISQLKKIHLFHKKRIKIAKYYQRMFKKKLPNLILPDNKYFKNSSHHLYIIKLNTKISVSRDELILWLKKNGVASNVHYMPIHLQPFFKSKGFKKGEFINSEKYGENALSIPMYPDLKLKDQKKIVNLIIKKLR
tara:strand:+ start:56 stop:1216 length:1161 start_codon:yes stop_codon:yes gene_type:complete